MEVIHPGLYSSIQDLGRYSFRNIGVPVSGVMDEFHGKLANRLLGNDENKAVLELTLQGGSFRFHKPTQIAITGAGLSPLLNNHLVRLNSVISVTENDVLQFGKPTYGVRAYIAVKGGFQTEEVLQSRSFYEGITQKGVIEKGDTLSYLEETKHIHTLTHVAIRSDIFKEIAIEVYEGPEFELLTKKQQQKLFNTEFTIGLNNRMAYQLEETIENAIPSIITSAVLPGTIQLTPSGKLIILMKDCQTTGGYPRILQLSDKSISVLSQKHAKNAVRFTKLSVL